MREVLPPGGRVGEGSRSPTPDDIRLEFGEPLKSSFVPEENPVGSSGATRNVDLDFVEDATEEANFEWGDEDENWGPISHEPYDMWIKLHGGQAHLVVEYLYSIRPQTGYWLSTPTYASKFFSPPQGEIVVYQHMLEFGLSFPLDPFIIRLLSAYNICLAQLCAKSIRHVINYL